MPFPMGSSLFSSKSMKFKSLVLTSLAALTGSAAASLIDFESYTSGALASVGGLNDNAFTGQDGWSASSGGAAGAIVATTSSGEYAGGKAVSSASGTTYIGANAGHVLSNTFGFDLRYGSGQELGVGHWNDDDADGKFDQSEAELMVGIVNDGASPYAFGVRAAGFGARIWSNGAGGTVSTGAGLGGTAGNWYRFTVTYTANGGNYDITVAVRDLTASTDIDFDSTTAGVQPWSFSVTSAQFGVATADAEGLVIRATTSGSNGVIDNIAPLGTGAPVNRIWDGGGSDAFWATAANWAGDVAPAAGDPIAFAGSAGLTNENNYAADTSFAGIAFSASADAFTLSGNRITLSGNLTNNSSAAQMIQLPLLLDGDRIVQGPLQLAGVVSGPHGLTKNGTSLMELTAANDYTGVLTVNAGSVNLHNDQSAANGGMVIGPASASVTTVTLNPGGTAAVATGKQISIGNTAATGTSTQKLEILGTMTHSGALYLGRVAQLTIGSGGLWAQSGDVSMNGIGGFSCNLDVLDGAAFNYTGSNPIQLNGTAGNSGQARLNVSDSGVFTTGKGFEQTTTPTTGYGRITLSSGGTLKLSSDVPALTTEVQFVLGTGGGVIDTNGFEGSLSGVVTVGGTQTGISGGGSLTKTGLGTLTATGVNTYTGDTIVGAGTLSLTTDSLSDASSVRITTGAILNLNHANTDTIDRLFIDGEPQSSGTWGSLTSTADHKTALITGDGLLDVTTGLGFAGWASTLGLSGNPDADFDFDGISDAIEYVTGSDPKTSNALDLSPDSSGTDLVITFPRDDSSETDDVTLVVEVGTTLDSWPTVLAVGADTGSSGSGVEVTENGAAPDIITVIIPKDGSPAKFARLKVTITP